MQFKKNADKSKWSAAKLSKMCNKKPVYVLIKFDGEEIFYTDFDKAVEAAEFGDYYDETKRISSYYEISGEDGRTYELISDGDPYYGRWTDEEGTIAEPSQVFTESKNLREAISLEADLLLKLTPLSETEIFQFMKNLHGGTYFNMGMYSSIPVARAYKKTLRIYKVIDLTAIVSGVSYENIKTTKDFRDRTGETPGKSWYDHTPGFENKIGQKKSDPSSKYVLWDIKRGSGTCVRYYVVDIDTGAVTPVSKEDILTSDYLTQTEKNKLTPKPVVGIDLTTGEAVENKTNWRTAAFEHIFWLNQAGKATQEYGVRFEEDLNLTEAFGDDLFMDAHAHVRTDLDAILSGEVVESVEKPLEEATEADIFMDAHAGVKTKLDDVLSGTMKESKKMKEDAFTDFELNETYESTNLKESYRRIVSRGKTLNENELFVDFD